VLEATIDRRGFQHVDAVEAEMARDAADGGPAEAGGLDDAALS
jgi:hypothetical protein